MANNVIATPEQRKEVRDFINKYKMNDEMDRLFGREDISAIINAGFEKTKKEIEDAESLFPDGSKEYATTVIEANGLYKIEDFSDNVRLVFERVIELSINVGIKKMKELVGIRVPDETVIRAGKEIIADAFTLEQISEKVEEIGGLYLGFFLKEATKPMESDQIPDAIRDLLKKAIE